MDTAGSPSLLSCYSNGGAKYRWKSSLFPRFSPVSPEHRRSENVSFGDLRLRRRLNPQRSRFIPLEISSCHKNFAASAVETQYSYAVSVDEGLILKKKSKEVIPLLNGRCLYLVGMMGSGKTTVGKVLAEVLGYSFYDSDKLVEQAVGADSVAQIFEEHNEIFFRDNETKVLQNLSTMHHIVVATGGGSVIRPINWRYMKQGVSVWLDVPLEALATRIAAVGTDSRPLLNQESGDPYKKAFMRLSTLFAERGRAYANADAIVCLRSMAAKWGHYNVSVLTPTAIGVEALNKIESFLTLKTHG